MDGVFDLVNLLFLAVAIGVLLRLRSVLGRRTGHEQPPQNRGWFASKPSKPEVVESESASAEAETPPREESASLTPLQRGLREISLADRSFDRERFLEGARIAYEQIVTGFAASNRERLQALLGADAFERFDAVMRSREQKGETAQCEVVAIQSADITEARMRGTAARVTVRFHADLLSSVRDKEGSIIDGNAEHPYRAEDIWTFERNTRDTNPNWRLVKSSHE
ncbi:MAG: Tim44/TimA family putative adaptor protein [Hyphomicrobiales bacterium]|nr:Tim44/TimA family putative adaptor protein [Hyphomicrobiales bacterium]MCY4033863.1 Tim44/TimA family putative adaptor protein [Hyphomicrobiales bacterium]